MTRFNYDLPDDRMPLVVNKSRRAASLCNAAGPAPRYPRSRVLAVVPFYVGSGKVRESSDGCIT